MNRTFNPKTKKITSIGEELRFQREYYCYKNNISLPLKIDSSDSKRDNRESLQDILYNYMYDRLDNNSESATSYDVLYAIENGKSKKKTAPYNPNTYFLRMFCLFKIYRFLDDMTILELMKDKYKLEPSFESSKNIINSIESNFSLQSLINNRQKGNAIKINIKNAKAMCSKDTYLKFCNNEEEKKEVENMYNKNLKKEQYGYSFRKEFPQKLLEDLKKLIKGNKKLSVDNIEKQLRIGTFESLIFAVKEFEKVVNQLEQAVESSNKLKSSEYDNFIIEYKKWLDNKDNYINKKIKVETPEDSLIFGYIFTEEKKQLQNKMKQLSQIERYCTSLELGRDTSYIDSFINNTLQNITLDTLLKTLEYFDMKEYKFYNILNIIKIDFSNESMYFSNLECV